MSSSRLTDEDSRLESVELQRLRRLAWLTDSVIGLPGGRRVGLDALVGLVPVVGDLLGALISLVFIYEARRMGVSRRTRRRMLGRIAIDFLVGSVPVAGDVFDAFYRVNERNLRTLEARVRSHRIAHPEVLQTA